MSRGEQCKGFFGVDLEFMRVLRADAVFRGSRDGGSEGNDGVAGVPVPSLMNYNVWK
jgi:hypothetical protein